MRDPESNVLEFIAGCAVDADIYYLAAALGPGHEYYDPDPGPPTRMFVFGRTPKEEWFYHDLQDFQVMSTEFVPEEEGGRPVVCLPWISMGSWKITPVLGQRSSTSRLKAPTFPEVLPVCDCWATSFSARAQEDRFIIGATADGGSFQPNSRLPSARRTKTSRIWMTSSVGSTISATCSNWAMLPHFLEIRWNATQSFAGDSPIGEPT